ncbi:hypothetical protein [Paraburkholderia sp.]|uniref:hypothetical protein n=1 Tax=Paraburkholderia sp. TaxID=1926495 RepID=UPI00286F7F44|nr:hypothetical protein [Paraburkholderia sp.]
MSGEIFSGIFGGLIAPVVSKWLGKFKLWKVFVASLVMIYLILYIIGVYFVGFKNSFFEMQQYFQLKVMLVASLVAACATLVAFLAHREIPKDGGK